jgi:hypothetical protein
MFKLETALLFPHLIYSIFIFSLSTPLTSLKQGSDISSGLLFNMLPHALTLLLKAACVALAVFVFLLLSKGFVWAIYTFLIAPRYDVLKNLPGPGKGALENHLREVME